jgi:hypothetical protein
MNFASDSQTLARLPTHELWKRSTPVLSLFGGAASLIEADGLMGVAVRSFSQPYFEPRRRFR